MDADLAVNRAEGWKTPAPGFGSAKGTIAVDMDDVLCQTNVTIVDMHRELFDYEPPIQLSDFKNYLYWHNYGWGSPQETLDMVRKLYASGLFTRTPLVEGAKEALWKLKNRGWRLIIITARSESQREGTEAWLADNLPDVFDEIHFTGAFTHLEPTKEEKAGHIAHKAVLSHRKRQKAAVVHETGSLFLIDDSAENALEASIAEPPAKVLLFGEYPWNAVVPRHSTKSIGMTYVERVKEGKLAEWEEQRERDIAEGWLPSGVERVKNWAEVLEWVDAFDQARQQET